MNAAWPYPEVTIIVATKGRPRELGLLLFALRRQTLLPTRVLIVGSCPADIEIDTENTPTPFPCFAWVAVQPGLTRQRNEGVAFLRTLTTLSSESIVIFFDDDFRPADGWIAECAKLFDSHKEIGAMTGRVLADGVRSGGFSEEAALSFLTGANAPQKHWATGEQRDISSVYGCNMGFRAASLLACRFDEALPSYGWQEDRDIAGQVRRFARVVFHPACEGVHLGSNCSRSSGLRVGYSQIANMLYLRRKGTADIANTVRFLCRALVGNFVKMLRSPDRSLYGARLRGNLLAVRHVFCGCCHPQHINRLP